MSLPRTKRLKYIDDAGQEVFQEDDRWHFLRAADPTAQASACFACTSSCTMTLSQFVPRQSAVPAAECLTQVPRRISFELLAYCSATLFLLWCGDPARCLRTARMRRQTAAGRPPPRPGRPWKSSRLHGCLPSSMKGYAASHFGQHTTQTALCALVCCRLVCCMRLSNQKCKG